MFLCVALIGSTASAGTSHIPFAVDFGHEAWIDFTELNQTQHELVCYLYSNSGSAHMFIFDNFFVTVETADLQPGESKFYIFKVLVGQPREVVNDQYGVVSAEGVSAQGDPVITPVDIQGGIIYLPALFK